MPWKRFCGFYDWGECVHVCVRTEASWSFSILSLHNEGFLLKGKKEMSMTIVITVSNMLWERNAGEQCEEVFIGKGGLT